MRRYFFQTIIVAATYLALHVLVCLFLPSPIRAEYWVRELIAIKRALANSIASPRIIALGGSSTLFSIDAKQIEEATGMRAMNFGLQAGMRLEQVLSVGEDVARRGDIVVLALEPVFYDCNGASWSDWQLNNALAWDRSFFDNLPLGTRIGAILSGGTPMLPFRILISKFGSIIDPEAYADRIRALAPIKTIWENYRSGKLRTSSVYSAYNVDDRGDMQNNTGAEFSGVGVPANEPSKVCPYAMSILANFVAHMKQKGARVIFAHTPYLIEAAPLAGWQEAETNFSRDVISTGATILDSRDELFLPRAYFFNTKLHLNRVGRRERTKIMIADFKKLGIGTTAQIDRGIGQAR